MEGKKEHEMNETEIGKEVKKMRRMKEKNEK